MREGETFTLNSTPHPTTVKNMCMDSINHCSPSSHCSCCIVIGETWWWEDSIVSSDGFQPMKGVN